MDTTQDQYLDYSDVQYVPRAEGIMVTTHRPAKFVVPYHHHASVELNLLYDCEMSYSFSGTKVSAFPDRLIVFWGAVPHCVTEVRGAGKIVNVYVGFSELLSWQLPDSFVDALIRGDVLCATTADEIDPIQFERWAAEFLRRDQGLNGLIAGEVEMRLRRFALKPWERLKSGQEDITGGGQGRDKMRYIEEMVRYIADHYGSAISVADVADHVNLSQNYAMTLFRKVIGVPIKEHITRIRLSHAQMLLSTTNMKILSIAMDSGFGSLSAFYEAFQARTGKTPAGFRRDARRPGG